MGELKESWTGVTKSYGRSDLRERRRKRRRFQPRDKRETTIEDLNPMVVAKRCGRREARMIKKGESDRTKIRAEDPRLMRGKAVAEVLVRHVPKRRKTSGRRKRKKRRKGVHP